MIIQFFYFIPYSFALYALDFEEWFLHFSFFFNNFFFLEFDDFFEKKLNKLGGVRCVGAI